MTLLEFKNSEIVQARLAHPATFKYWQRWRVSPAVGDGVPSIWTSLPSRLLLFAFAILMIARIIVTSIICSLFNQYSQLLPIL
jgi:hypothetical protein